MVYTSRVPTAATRQATIGAAIAGMTIEVSTPSHFTPDTPSAAIAEPISPPNSACEDEDGRPNSQVMRFQRMPPTSPANTMVRMGIPISAVIGAPSGPWMLTTLLLTVSATSILRKAPTRLSTAQSATAILGRSAPLAIEVAMALPVSWKPLVKSNAKAVTTTTTNTKDASVTIEW